MAKETTRVIWLKRASQDLEEICQYIGAQSPTYASGMIDRIVQAADALGTFPRMGAAAIETQAFR